MPQTGLTFDFSSLNFFLSFGITVFVKWKKKVENEKEKKMWTEKRCCGSNSNCKKSVTFRLFLLLTEFLFFLLLFSFCYFLFSRSIYVPLIYHFFRYYCFFFFTPLIPHFTAFYPEWFTRIHQINYFGYTCGDSMSYVSTMYHWMWLLKSTISKWKKKNDSVFCCKPKWKCSQTDSDIWEKKNLRRCEWKK